MRLNLTFKFFIAFLATSVTIVVVMVGAMQYFARRNFTDYVRKVEAIRLAELSLALQEEYEKSNGWQRLRDNPHRWRRLLRPGGSAAYVEAPPAMPRGYEGALKPPPPPPPPPRRGLRPPDRKSGPADRDRLREPPGGRPRPENPGSRPGRPPLGIEHRLSLFDADGALIVGRAASTNGHSLQKITVEGKTVGWLGLRNEPLPTSPLDTAFLRQQARAFYLAGGIMVVLAAAVALLLSRHLLAPVRELVAGTRHLSARRFDTRIAVATSDELGQLARDFNQMAQTLQRYEQLRQQWICDIAHELRTPLAILRGEIEALQDGVRQATPERLESLHAEALHMSGLVQNLHDLSLAESGALHVKKEPVSPACLVHACLQKFRPRFDERGIALVDELGDAGTAAVAGDPDRLMQVFSNILENALRYADGPGTLTLRGLRGAREVLLQVADTGPGVPGDALPRLFDRLYRVDASRSREHGGSGLGLAICKAIIEAHGGAIAAQHAPGGGLQLAITLPLHTGHVEPAGQDHGASKHSHR